MTIGKKSSPLSFIKCHPRPHQAPAVGSRVMPRQGQKAMKRQYDESADKSETVGSQALPVADLPDDWIGVPEDGATYLALARWVSSLDQDQASQATYVRRADGQSGELEITIRHSCTYRLCSPRRRRSRPINHHFCSTHHTSRLDLSPPRLANGNMARQLHIPLHDLPPISRPALASKQRRLSSQQR